jgi:hypothetical protein
LDCLLPKNKKEEMSGGERRELPSETTVPSSNHIIDQRYNI